MDKGLGSFLKISGLLLVLVLGLLAFFGYVLNYFTLSTYRSILLAGMTGFIACILLFIGSALLLLYVYFGNKINPIFITPLKMAINLLLPLMAFMYDIFHAGGKEPLRRFYIHMNNMLVNLKAKRFKPQEVLLLLPHCLQDSSCSHKITSDISNCKRCGKCCVGDIVDIAGRFGVKAAVVTGGTVARKLVESEKYKMILSVACERDLASGIADVHKFPVIGVLNERPNGPCYNTKVDVEHLAARLKELLE